MIFIGDIAHPFNTPPAWSDNEWPWSSGQSVIGNLEGAFVGENSSYLNQRKVFNHISLLDAFSKCGFGAATLANNHIMDVPNALTGTCALLNEHGIKFTGAGESERSAAIPAKLVHANQKWLFLSFGWETIQCRAAGQHTPGVNPFRPDHLLKQIVDARNDYPDAVLVILPHWNIELELYPQPAHRQVAMAAIDAGADAVIGHHPHRVGGLEMYKDKPIAYSLGNWWMPHGVFFGGKLSFGDETLLQLALEWEPGIDPICHWFKYNRDGHQITYLKSEPWLESEQMCKLTPFSGMSHNQYKKWFPKNRVKRKALPMYYDYQNKVANGCKDRYIHLRQAGIKFLEGSGLRRILK